MTDSSVVALLAITDRARQKQWVSDNLPLVDNDLVEALKNEAIQLRMVDTRAALEIAEMIDFIYRQTGVARHRGYSLWAEAIVRSLGLGEYERALALYDKAISIFKNEGDDLSPALMQISRLWSLANLNRNAEAFAAGEAAAVVLADHGRKRSLATLQMNLASVYTRIGEYARALTMYENCRAIYEELGLNTEDIQVAWALVLNNIAISLCYLGRFDESIAASHKALAVHEQQGNRLEAARVQQHLAVTYFILGRYNESLRVLDQVRDILATDGLHRHVARVDLYICECLLRLRRFDRVLAKIPAIRETFALIQALHEQGIVLVYEAVAKAGQGNFSSALESLAEAHQTFSEEGNRSWQGNCDLEVAQILNQQGRHGESHRNAIRAAEYFHAEGLRVREAEALVLAAHARFQQGDHQAATDLLESIRHIDESEDVPILLFQFHHLLGQMAWAADDLDQSVTELQQAIVAVERLRAHLMIDLRVNFQEDKQMLYEDMVAVCLERGEPARGLHYADRAKSRTLVEMVDHRIEMHLHARQAADQPLVERMMELRARRDQFYRHGENRDVSAERSAIARFSESEQRQLSRLDNEIAELWDMLLIRNADYAEDVSLWQTTDHPLDLSTPDDTALVEYFSLHGKLIAFVVKQGNVQVYQLGVDVLSMRRLVERWHQHLRTVHLFPSERLPLLVNQAQHLLNQLFLALVKPLAVALEMVQRLIIVPHGVLHYAPFHAFFDGSAYLIERYDVSYLPNAALMNRTSRRAMASEGILSLGYAADNSLPFVVDEALAVAHLFDEPAIVEAAAVRHHLSNSAGEKRIVHLAAHAEFNDDQPLFSGLLLADGWLTTLDVFNLELTADLVTLSACQTGRSTLGGGDELLGLMRAFLCAGANALVMSMWSVEDRSTSILMQEFYRLLQNGCTKAAALSLVQRQFVQAAPKIDASAHFDYRHPYFWAPFFLVGDVSALMS